MIARHTYEIEKISNLLKGAATRQLKDDDRHPLVGFKRPDGKIPPMGSSHQWKVFLDSEEAIEEAIHYVEMNPVKEGKLAQAWKHRKASSLLLSVRMQTNIENDFKR